MANRGPVSPDSPGRDCPASAHAPWHGGMVFPCTAGTAAPARQPSIPSRQEQVLTVSVTGDPLPLPSLSGQRWWSIFSGAPGRVGGPGFCKVHKVDSTRRWSAGEDAGPQ